MANTPFPAGCPDRHFRRRSRSGASDSVAAMAFTGIPHDALVFYEQLEADNSKAFWETNRARFNDVVRGPAQELAAELADYGNFHLFRPHNDLRFSKNKPPYKTHQGA